eukprot:m51a1_g2747 putative protein kinase domain containing protein (917) ;mRNA; f:946433-949686
MRVLSLCLRLLAVVAPLVASQCSPGAGYTLVKYDAVNWPQQPATAPLLPAGTCSPPFLGSSVEIVQLITPPAVPWDVTTVCLQLNATIVSTETVEVTLYREDSGAPSAAPVFTQKFSVPLTSSAFHLDTSWVNVAPTGLVVDDQHMYLGIRVVAPCNRITYNTQMLWKGRRAFWRALSADPWSLFAADWAHDNATVVPIRTVGIARKGVPPSWTACAASLYNDSVCHCECGAPDPDCKATAVSPSCSAAGTVCSPLGHCVKPGWNEAVCPLKLYGIGDGCQCGCGGTLIDPDCRLSSEAGAWYPRALNCPGIAKCNDAGACQDAWTGCSTSKFGDGVCDCKCGVLGVLDPDCLTTNNSDCGSMSTCMSGGCRAFPSAWQCVPSMYNQFPQATHHSSKHCQCNCGAFDPDCTFQPESSIYWADGCDPDRMVCGINGTCKVSSPHGDGIVDSYEDCDSGRACGTNGRCLTGYIQTNPKSLGCVENCGDSLVVGSEDCDGGAFCSSTCKCLAGHSPISQRFCSGCGNGFKESSEECDSGVGCDSTCKCVHGYMSADNQSRDCVQAHSFCGDSSVDPGEDCDGGSFCHWQNCTCYDGHLPYTQRSKSCRGCGNGVEEDSEECDGTEGCAPQTCTCVQGYVKYAGVSGCQLIPELCGNGKLDSNEECDGGVFCKAGCVCEAGHSPVKQTFCGGCGNDWVDDGEQCDGGYGCVDCTCGSDFTPSNPPTVSCTWVSPRDQSGNLSVVVHRKKDARVVGAAAGVSVGVAFVVCCILGAVVRIVSSIRKKEEPSRPIESTDTQLNFVAAAPVGGVNLSGTPNTMFTHQAMSSSEMARSTPYVHSRAADGTPIVVVPCGGLDLSEQKDGIEIVPGNVVPAGPLDPLVSMSLSTQLPQITSMVQHSVSAADGTAAGFSGPHTAPVSQ